MSRGLMICAVWSSSALAGCNAGFDSEGGQLHFDPVGVVADPFSGLNPDHPILAGSTICVAISSIDDAFPEDQDVGECFRQRVLGAGSLAEDNCVTIDEAGEVEWWLEAIDCPANGAGYAPVDDYVHYMGVGSSAVAATLPWWAEELAEQILEPAAGSWPDDWTAPGEPFSVLAGSVIHLPVELTHPDFDYAVAWVPDEATLTVTQTGTADVGASWTDPGWLEITVPKGASADLMLTLHDRTWQIASVESVLADEVDTIQVVAAYGPGEEKGTRSPFGARAVLWTTDGRPVLGAPVEWSITRGALAVRTMEGKLGTDYVVLEDSCVPPSERVGTERARLNASWTGLKDDVDLNWVTRYEPEPSWDVDDPDDGWTADPDCDEGCGCAAASQRAPGGPLALLSGLLGLALRRRQRRAPERGARRPGA